MKGLWHIAAGILLFTPYCVVAQNNYFPSRHELDSLVNPQQSEKSEGMLRVEPEVVDLGTIEGEDLINFGFALCNRSQQRVTITELRSSCGCIKILSKPKTIEPNETFRVDARFNPAGRNSSFMYSILIYTDLDKERPTRRITVKGNVISSDEWQHLPVRAGALRLSRKEIVLNGRGEERIAVANSSDKPMTITAHSTVAGLTLRCEPEVLEPHSDGDIIVSYKGDVETALNTMLILEGMNCTPSERMIRVIIKR